MDENFVAFSYAMTMRTDELERAFYETCERLTCKTPGNSDVLSLSNIFTAYAHKSTVERERTLMSLRYAEGEINRMTKAVRELSDEVLGTDYE